MKSDPLKIPRWIIWTLLALVVLGCAGVEPLFVLAFGWIGFLRRVAPQIHVRWDIVAGSSLCAVVLVIGAHLFLRWLYRQIGGDNASPNGHRWRTRWTLSGTALVLLMFSAGIGMIGVIHQTAWMATSPERLTEMGFVRRGRENCAKNLSTLGQAIQRYCNENGGHYPDDWPTLLLKSDLPAETFVCPASNFDAPASGATRQEIADKLMQPRYCSYIYYGKGLSVPVDPNRVIAAEPLLNHGEGIHVLFADGQVEWAERDQATKLLAKMAAVTQPTTRER